MPTISRWSIPKPRGVISEQPDITRALIAEELRLERNAKKRWLQQYTTPQHTAAPLPAIESATALASVAAPAPAPRPPPRCVVLAPMGGFFVAGRVVQVTPPLQLKTAAEGDAAAQIQDCSRMTPRLQLKTAAAVDAAPPTQDCSSSALLVSLGS